MIIHKLATATIIVLMATAASAQGVDYNQCRQIVATHSFMMEARKACRIKLAKDTSALAYQCVNALSEFHRNLAIYYGREEVWKPFLKRNGKSTCQKVKDDFNPLIAD